MRILNQEFDLDIFYERLKQASQRILLLDYDGTLAPFKEDPKEAHPYPGVIGLLDNIIRMDDIQLVIISGRGIDDLLPLLSMDIKPEIWGSHGLERLKKDGTRETISIDENAIRGLEKAGELIESLGFSDRGERKKGCFALHWRGMDTDCIKVMKGMVEPEWSVIAKDYGLNVEEFDGGMELRLPGINKGHAVRTILEEIQNDFVAAYLGDDATDEDAFIAVKNQGLGVLVREELRPTAADLWIKPPEELMVFLQNWLNKGTG